MTYREERQKERTGTSGRRAAKEKLRAGEAIVRVANVSVMINRNVEYFMIQCVVIDAQLKAEENSHGIDAARDPTFHNFNRLYKS